MEVGGPRLHLTPVDSMPLVTLSKPRLVGGRRVLKAAFDKVGATALVVVLSPVLVFTAVAVKLDGGPVFRREPRVGEGGRLYAMTRFRITRPDDDGRFSGIGRVLQQYSIDELPQLLDVLVGTMSLVGPRPPRPVEMDGSDVEAMRRLLVRPGMTGLWQVLRDREHLDWDESVRLDLRYVENWSLALDAQILSKTLGAVVKSRGAY
jgi:lipopolysaccharide/colanic/teichoic acid biosynthesis glycosyltransferase